MSTNVLHTECGDVQLDERTMALYQALSSDRFRVFTKEELCRMTGEPSARALDATAARLRFRIARVTALAMVTNVWGIGYRLEVEP